MPTKDWKRTLARWAAEGGLPALSIGLAIAWLWG